MNKKKVGQLRLGKITIQDFGTTLGRNEQKKIKGGIVNAPEPTTDVPVYCKSG
ncbi:MAG: hypothetical protein GY940_45830 [bacterium]|nr:hypothetical protein [bacterium]